MNMEKKSKWKNRTQCSAINCKNYACNRTDVAFHRFPKEPDRCARWVQNLRNASLRGISPEQLNHSYRVCSEHFHSTQFKRSDVHAGLKWNAVPTIVNAPNPPRPVDPEPKREKPKTPQELPLKKRIKSEVIYLPNAGSSPADGVQRPACPETDVTPPSAPAAAPSVPPTPALPPVPLPSDPEAAAREHALKKKIRSLQVQVCKLKARLREMNQLKRERKAGVSKAAVMERLKELLPDNTFAFVRTQIRHSQRKAHGFRWSAQDKAFFSSLLYASPQGYRLLCKVFSMPSIRTLQKAKKAMETAEAVDTICAIMSDENAK